MNHLMEVAATFWVIGLLLTGFRKGELTGYCFMVSAFFLVIFFASEGNKLMAGAEILAIILAAIFAWKVREYRKLQETEKGTECKL